MTVILAALYDNGKGAVVVSDKMRTTSYGEDEDHLTTFSVENEDIKKIFRINKHVTVASAGDSGFWSNVIDKLQMSINQSDKCSKVITKLEDIYRTEMEDLLAMKVLFPYYKRYSEFREDVPRLAKDLPSLLGAFENNLIEARKHVPNEFLLIGKDNNKFYKLYTLGPSGRLELIRRGYQVLGSGHKYAFEPVTEQLRLSQSREQVEIILLNAKRLAEQDDEVGTQTHIEYLSIE